MRAGPEWERQVRVLKLIEALRALIRKRRSLTHSNEALAGDLHNQYILSISGEVPKERAGGEKEMKGTETLYRISLLREA